MMKKWTMLLLSALMVFTLTACGSTQKENGTTAEGSTEESKKAGKILVVYFSATGNTEEVANYIAAASKADLFELVPTQKYSDADLDWTDSDSRVSREHDNPEERVVPLTADTVENWDSYDTVLIGYLIQRDIDA